MRILRNITVKFSLYTGFALLGALLILPGCTPKSSHLRPVSDSAESDPSKPQVRVDILPIDTFGFGNKQRRRIGMDLSGFFTVFELEVSNGTGKTVRFDPLDSVLEISIGNTLTPLSEEDAVGYYGNTPRTVAAREREEKIIREKFLRGGELQTGEAAKGMLYFRKVPPGDCRTVRLFLNGIRVSGEGGSRPFKFEFLCPSRP